MYRGMKDSSESSKQQQNTTSSTSAAAQSAARRQERVSFLNRRGSSNLSSSSDEKPIKKVRKQVGTALQRINIGKWIDDLEDDQQLADRLEFVNQELQQEQEHKEFCQKVNKAHMEAIREHLILFVKEHPHSTYEEWIAELHPENVDFQGNIDHRFYVQESDHRRLWNAFCGHEGIPRTHVLPRTLDK